MTPEYHRGELIPSAVVYHTSWPAALLIPLVEAEPTTFVPIIYCESLLRGNSGRTGAVTSHVADFSHSLFLYSIMKYNSLLLLLQKYQSSDLIQFENNFFFGAGGSQKLSTFIK